MDDHGPVAASSSRRRKHSSACCSRASVFFFEGRSSSSWEVGRPDPPPQLRHGKLVGLTQCFLGGATQVSRHLSGANAVPGLMRAAAEPTYFAGIAAPRMALRSAATASANARSCAACSYRRLAAPQHPLQRVRVPLQPFASVQACAHVERARASRSLGSRSGSVVEESGPAGIRSSKARLWHMLLRLTHQLAHVQPDPPITRTQHCTRAESRQTDNRCATLPQPALRANVWHLQPYASWCTVTRISDHSKHQPVPVRQTASSRHAPAKSHNVEEEDA